MNELATLRVATVTEFHVQHKSDQQLWVDLPYQSHMYNTSKLQVYLGEVKKEGVQVEVEEVCSNLADVLTTTRMSLYKMLFYPESIVPW